MKDKLIVYGIALATGFVFGLAIVRSVDAQTASAGLYELQNANYSAEHIQGGAYNTAIQLQNAQYSVQGSTYKVQ